MDNDLIMGYATQMGRHCFDGDIPAFRRAFKSYLSRQSGADPHGRLLLGQQAARGPGLLAFRSTSTDAQYLHAQSRLRWDAWLSVLPLDMQLDQLIMESTPRTPGVVDPATLKWDQWWDILSSPDPAVAYLDSPLCHPSPDVPVAEDASVHGRALWVKKQDHLISSLQCHAMQLMAWKSWEELEALMAAGRMQAREAVADVHVHYAGKHSRGSTLAKAVQPLPFWLMGLFTGAHEPDLWEVMKRFGGPTGPAAVFQEMANPGAAMPPTSNPGSGRRLASCPSARQWVDPLSWVEPCVSLGANAINLVDLTRASWERDSMDEGVSSGFQARKPSSPFSRI